jgi:hypothetical protein
MNLLLLTAQLSDDTESVFRSLCLVDAFETVSLMQICCAILARKL